MAGSRISGTVTHTVLLGGANYPSPLIITRTGSVLPLDVGATGVYLPEYMAGARLVNHGVIDGGPGGADLFAYNGGVGVDLLSSATLRNTGSISGGNGLAAYQLDNPASDGGIGVVLQRFGDFSNVGTVSGGLGGYNVIDSGGNGGDAVWMPGGGLLNNGGVLAGGNGGDTYGQTHGNAGSGGYGAVLSGSTVATNSGTIRGGAAGFGMSGNSGVGGIGILLESWTSLTNTGSVSGGGGGNVGYRAPGYGGAGVSLLDHSSLMNLGTITGGIGVHADGIRGGGDGVMIGADCACLNEGVIKGGYSYGEGYSEPVGVGVYVNGGTLTNAGTIAGGLFAVPGDRSAAVRFGPMAGVLDLVPGSVIVGQVIADVTANDVLGLAGMGIGTITGLGTQYVGFAAIDSAAGSKWVVAESNLLDTATRLAVAGKLDVTGILRDAGSGTINAGGVLKASGVGTLTIGGLTMTGGELACAAHAAVVAGKADAAQAGTILVAHGARIAGFGDIAGALLQDDGRVDAQGGTLAIGGAVSGAGTLLIDSGAVLSVAGAVSVANIAFAGPASLIEAVPDSAGASPLFRGFGAGDSIDLEKLTATSDNFADGTLTLYNGTNGVDALGFAGDYTTGDFGLSSDGHGGSELFYAATGWDLPPRSQNWPTLHVDAAHGEVLSCRCSP